MLLCAVLIVLVVSLQENAALADQLTGVEDRIKRVELERE